MMTDSRRASSHDVRRRRRSALWSVAALVGLALALYAGPAPDRPRRSEATDGQGGAALVIRDPQMVNDLKMMAPLRGLDLSIVGDTVVMPLPQITQANLVESLERLAKADEASALKP